jgi:hypothetical protein
MFKRTGTIDCCKCNLYCDDYLFNEAIAFLESVSPLPQLVLLCTTIGKAKFYRSSICEGLGLGKPV